MEHHITNGVARPGLYMQRTGLCMQRTGLCMQRTGHRNESRSEAQQHGKGQAEPCIAGGQDGEGGCTSRGPAGLFLLVFLQRVVGCKRRGTKGGGMQWRERGGRGEGQGAPAQAPQPQLQPQ